MPVKVTIQDLSEEKEQRNRAVIYARYSSERQNVTSIEQQIRECMDYINRKGYELIKVYSDKAKSASKDIEKRKDFMNLIGDSSNGSFDVVVAYALDRISREEHGGFYEYEKILNTNGVRIEYATQEFNEEYGGGISKAVHIEMASEYVVQLRKNVVRGMRDNAMHGYHNGGRSLPVGIKLVGDDKKDKRFAPKEETREYILKAFEMYVAGDTTKEICDYLNNNGVRTYAGKMLTINSVNRMLANPIYKGTKVTVFNNKIEHKAYIVDNACEAIVSEELWDKVQEERIKRLHIGAAEKTRGVYELRGKLFCGECGGAMVADGGTSHTGEVHKYYACRNKKEKRRTDPDRCYKKNIPKEQIESAVIEIISDFIWNEKLIQEYINAAEKVDRKVTVNPRIAELEKEIRNHKERKSRADNAYMDTGDKEWLEKSKDEKKLIDKAEKELKTINNLSKYSKDARDFIKEIYELRDIWVELQSTPEGRTNIVKSFIDRIEVTDDKDDPDKYKLKLYIKADPDSNASTELDAAVNLKVQDCLAKVHQKAKRLSKGRRFASFYYSFSLF